MAARARKRPVMNAERDAAAELQAVNVRTARHITGCGQCVRAGQDFAKRCDAGWELAKAQKRAQTAVQAARDAASSRPLQGVLW